MDKFHRIENNNGVLLTGKIPVDLQSFRGQARLRDYAWRITEELGEAMHAQDPDYRREEIVDALHFLVELCIASGLEAREIVPGDRTPDEGDNLSVLVDRIQMADVGILHFEYVVAVFIRELAMTINLLTNRPWKQKRRDVSPLIFRNELIKLVWRFGILCVVLGFTSDTLYQGYFNKAKTNQQRITSGV